MTNLDAIRADSNPATFPVDVLRGAEDAACFFCAGFLGRNDVIHVADAGVLHALLVDIDEGKLQEMHGAYPTTWSYRCGDAYTVARDLARIGTRLDVVIVDPWTGEMGSAIARLPLWVEIAERHVVVGVAMPWFRGKRIEPTAEGFGAWVAAQHWDAGRKLPVRCVELRKRSDYVGGVFWGVLAVDRG